jgi:hypothetical protein
VDLEFARDDLSRAASTAPRISAVISASLFSSIA